MKYLQTVTLLCGGQLSAAQKSAVVGRLTVMSDCADKKSGTVAVAKVASHYYTSNTLVCMYT